MVAVLATGVEVPVNEFNLPVVSKVLLKAKVLPEVAPALKRKEESPSMLSSPVK